MNMMRGVDDFVLVAYREDLSFQLMRLNAYLLSIMELLSLTFCSL